mgnify:CR=1 FL=1
MANRYDITVRGFANKSVDDNVQEMLVQQFNDMTADELDQWILHWMLQSVADYRRGCNSAVYDNEQDIIEEFHELAQTIEELEQCHNIKSKTIGLLDGFVTVQVIYGDEST